MTILPGGRFRLARLGSHTIQPPEIPSGLDPEMAEVMRLAHVQSSRLGPLPDPNDLPGQRARMIAERAWWNVDPPCMSDVVDRDFMVGDTAVPIRILRPSAETPLPTIIYLHGGGWVLGNLQSHSKVMKLMAVGSGCQVIGVEYSKSPESTYPVALNETLAVIEQVFSNPESFKAMPGRIALAGDSNGGCLCLAAMLARRDAGQPPPQIATLFYPSISTNFSTESHVRFGGGNYPLTTASLKRSWRLYLGSTGHSDDPLAVPLATRRFSNLPPIHLFTGEADALADDSHRLAARLEAADVPHSLNMVPGVCHGFLHATRVLDKASKTLNEAGALIRQALWEPTPEP